MRMLSTGRRRGIFLIGLLAVVLGGIAVWSAVGQNEPKPLPAAVDPLLPDLVMAPIDSVVGTFGGSPIEPFMAFNASIANIGEGDFIVSARRSWPWSGDWSVYQRIRERGGGFTEDLTTTSMVYGGDQHDHWHVRAVEAHRLENIATGEVLAEVVKLGFCFFDVGPYEPSLPGAPTGPRWNETACDGRVSTNLILGLSVGWEDIYPSDMVEQRIPLTGIKTGRYRLHEIADPNDVFQESDETNNETWVDVEIENPGSGFPRVTVVGVKPNP